MKTKTKNVYYCDFCKRHGLSRFHMEAHERRCTLNPDRECRWEAPHTFDYRALAATASKSYPPLIAWLRQETDGCPACMLAIVRQAGINLGQLRDDTGWTYDDEVERFRTAEREQQYRQQQDDDYRAATYGWAS